MAYRLKNLNVLWVQERNPDVPSFSFKKSRQVIPSKFPNGVPMEREMPPYREFLHIS
jgi:hypothetical protein